MSKLDLIAVCDMAFITKDSNNLNLIGIFKNIRFSSFPAVHQRFAVVMVIETANDGEHRARLMIKKNGKEAVTVERPFKGRRYRWIQNFINFTFPEPGEYIIEVYIGDELLGSTSVNLAEK